MNVRVVSYIDWSPKSIEWLGGIRYILRMVVPELRLVWSTYHINKGTDDAIAGTHQLLDYMANRCGPVSVIRSDADCFKSAAYTTAMAARGVDVEVHAANDAQATGPVERYIGIINDLVTKALLHAKFPEMLAQAFDRQAHLILCIYLISDFGAPRSASSTGSHGSHRHTNEPVCNGIRGVLPGRESRQEQVQTVYSEALRLYSRRNAKQCRDSHLRFQWLEKLQHSSPRSYRVLEQVKMREEIPKPLVPYAKATGIARHVGFPRMRPGITISRITVRITMDYMETTVNKYVFTSFLDLNIRS